VITTRSAKLLPASSKPTPKRTDTAGSEASAVSCPTDFRTGAVTAPTHRHHPHEGPLRVLVGKERFSENHAWSEMPQHWAAGLVGRAVIEVVGQGQLEARLVDSGPAVDVVVPMWSPLPRRAIRAGSFGLIQQFGVGVDNIDLDAAAGEGVWVANMPGLNAVPVAEHTVALLLAVARRLPEASKGFEPGRWGEPAGRSLAGTAACIVGAGAIGTQIARRLAAFDVTVTGVRRHPPDGPVPPFAAVYAADRLLECVADVDSVISHPPDSSDERDTNLLWPASQRHHRRLHRVQHGRSLRGSRPVRAQLSRAAPAASRPPPRDLHPVQIITGRRDPLVPVANAEFLLVRLPNSRLEVLDAGHFVWEEAARQYGAVITAWVSGGAT
jgi:pimeloyl-ACP methyl ester carboxylesterase